MEVKDLKPVLLWQFFDRITQIPRPSKREGKIVSFLLDFAEQQGLEAKKDKAGNVLIRKPASKGRENLKTVILQSHVDMVCEKNAGVNFNFETDSIRTYIDNGWVRAKGTTLGSDDGIGVAAALAILASEDIEHGPVECLFTTDEETGLTGAYALSRDFLTGGDILINLDSEEWGEFCIGCAGGKNTLGIFHYTKTNPPAGYFWFEVQVGGLNGGHSGSDINAGLGNANKILTRYLWTLLQECPLLLSDIDGGNLHNAIAREARATVGVPDAFKEKVSVWLNVLQADLSVELAKVDKNVKLSVHSVEKPAYCIDAGTGNNLLNALYAMPHGVMGMSHEMAGLVETSTNLSSVKMKGDETITVTTSQRSSTESLKTDIANRVRAVFLQAGAEVSATEGYPGWKPNPDSTILKLSESLFEHLFNEKPEVIAIHAGLECGLFFEKNPKLDMISCGPTILGAHSPDERLEIETVGKWWKFLLELLKAIPEKTD
ncbi:MAG: aminoacyl-histidine dipeptidase [Dysgonamonadaceae bacterium]|jgi:dipeptidase D|nr:aminoacyl-histidine dipeptidase [Dysgonamonadaceae bacterium]